MNKYILRIVSASMILASCVSECLAQESALEFKYDEQSKTACVLGFVQSNEVTQLQIPEKVKLDGNEYTVTKINKKAFSRYESLTSVYIPNSVTEIGDEAFYDCTLSNIEIPNSVTEIGRDAFGDCPLSPGLLIYNNGTKCYGWIGDQSQCVNVVIPESVTEIGRAAFRGCYNLTSIKIPNSVTKIDDNSFSYCRNIKKIVIPNSVTYIGPGAFKSCESLINIEIPNSVITIEGGAFTDCTNLASIEIPNSVTIIDNIFMVVQIPQALEYLTQ